MNEASNVTGAAGSRAGAIEFTGNWKEYLPIAISNALLTIVTLGIYRFWAAARQRRYLWAHTRVIDDMLEWTGTGKEMFVGFLFVTAILLPFFLAFQFLFPALFSRGQELAAVLIMGVFYFGLIYLGGFARFRALRYRLSRSWWHGIRGGSDDKGWDYANEFFGRFILNGMTLFIAYPWNAVALWNKRWNAMSFGQTPFQADLSVDGLRRRWFVLYAIPFVIVLAVAAMGVTAALAGAQENAPSGMVAWVAILIFFLYLLFPLALMHFYAKFYRRGADSTRLGGLQFGFRATTWGWVKLYLGNIALVIVTLGFGLTY